MFPFPELVGMVDRLYLSLCVFAWYPLLRGTRRHQVTKAYDTVSAHLKIKKNPKNLSPEFTPNRIAIISPNPCPQSKLFFMILPKTYYHRFFFWSLLYVVRPLWYKSQLNRLFRKCIRIIQKATVRNN